MQKNALATLAFAVVVNFPAGAHPDGAGTCIAEPQTITGMQMRPRMTPGTGPFTVRLESANYQPGATHFLTIASADNSTLAGFLVYAERLVGGRVGVFDKSGDTVGSPRATCPDDPDATASHTQLGPVAATSITIPWQAPATDVGPLFFRSIVLGGMRGDTSSQAFYFPEPLLVEASVEALFCSGFEDPARCGAGAQKSQPPTFDRWLAQGWKQAPIALGLSRTRSNATGLLLE